MNDLMNHVQLIGNTGKEVEIRTFDSGSKKASVSFATTKYFKNTKGEMEKRTQWHNLIAWGKNAELLKKAVDKGDRLIVNGSINYREYESKEGVKKQTTEILIDNFMRTSFTKSQTSSTNDSIKKEVLPF